MDTNICLYCEMPLTDTCELLGFCSGVCHEKEALKTKIPPWAVFRPHRHARLLSPMSADGRGRVARLVSSSSVPTTGISLNYAYSQRLYQQQQQQQQQRHHLHPPQHQHPHHLRHPLHHTSLSSPHTMPLNNHHSRRPHVSTTL
ncbi:hypothetical protein BC940DRAFT_365632 [Gongronella butleri]|nr:hypothetical protein BC940DRAFT_365632 [Gongronella butleri]